MGAHPVKTRALEVGLAFVDAINRHDVGALVTLMTEDHCFVDGLGQVVGGREQMKNGWIGYFRMVP
jgi:ketosteroid isomerase-like protein